MNIRFINYNVGSLIVTEEYINIIFRKGIDFTENYN